MLKKELKWLFDEVPGLLMLIGLMLLALFIIFVPKNLAENPQDYYIDVYVQQPAEGFQLYDNYFVNLDGTGEVSGIKAPSSSVSPPVFRSNEGNRVYDSTEGYFTVIFPSIDLDFKIYPEAENCRWPSFSPDGKFISLTCGTDIYIMRPNGEGLTNLTNGEGSNLESMFSPDSQRIIFSSQRDELTGKEFQIHTEDNLILPFTRLYSMALDGSDVIPLTFRLDENIRVFGWFQEDR